MYKIYKETLDLFLWISEIQAQNAVELPPEFHRIINDAHEYKCGYHTTNEELKSPRDTSRNNLTYVPRARA